MNRARVGEFRPIRSGNRTAPTPVPNGFRSRSPAAACVPAVVSFRVQFKINDLTADDLPTPVGRRQFRPAQVLINLRQFGVGRDFREAKRLAGREVRPGNPQQSRKSPRLGAGTGLLKHLPQDIDSGPVPLYPLIQNICVLDDQFGPPGLQVFDVGLDLGHELDELLLAVVTDVQGCPSIGSTAFLEIQTAQLMSYQRRQTAKAAATSH